MAAGTKSKLTLWVDREAGQFGKEWARRNHASLSQLVTDYLSRLKDSAQAQSSVTPKVLKLSGVLKGRGASKEAYGRHLEKKYLGP